MSVKLTSDKMLQYQNDPALHALVNHALNIARFRAEWEQPEEFINLFSTYNKLLRDRNTFLEEEVIRLRQLVLEPLKFKHGKTL